MKVTVELDEAPRVVACPRELMAALRKTPGAVARWSTLSSSHQKEYAEAIESAKKPETRARRIASAVETISRRPLRSR